MTFTINDTMRIRTIAPMYTHHLTKDTKHNHSSPSQTPSKQAIIFPNIRAGKSLPVIETAIVPIIV